MSPPPDDRAYGYPTDPAAAYTPPYGRAPASAVPPRPPRAWTGALLTLLVIAAIGAGTFLFITRDVPTKIEVDGRPITNANTILERAETAFDELAKADGATPAAGAGCWFAPPVDKASAWQGPRLACGPVLLGVSGTTKPWVIGRALYSTSLNGDDATGTFEAFESVADPDADDFVRPDGREPPDSSGLRPATGGIRTADGRRLSGDQAVIDTLDQAFAGAAKDAGASVAEGSACFFGGKRNPSDQFLTDGTVWCGPVLLPNSAPDALWARSSFTAGAGDSFALAEATSPSSFSLSSTSPLAPGTDLIRPDGKPVADSAGLRPPGAGPLEGGSVVVLPEAPADVPLEAPDDGRLNIPSRSLTLTGLARVDQLGAGAEALVPAEGENLVVAVFETAPVEDGPSDTGTAQLVIDGQASPFDGWSGLGATGAMVAAVPEDAQDVVLEVGFDGVTQQISLLTGERAEGFPPVLYREQTVVDVGANLAANAAMPVGDPASATGVVSEVRLVAWLDGKGWAAEGKAFLVVIISDWAAQPPCCEVTGAEIIPLFTFTPAGQARLDTAVELETTQPEPTFEVPADVTTGSLDLRLLVQFQRDGGPGSAGGEPVRVPIDVPA
jgi:hypothetical protein